VEMCAAVLVRSTVYSAAALWRGFEVAKGVEVPHLEALVPALRPPCSSLVLSMQHIELAE